MQNISTYKYQLYVCMFGWWVNSQIDRIALDNGKMAAKLEHIN